MTRHIAKAKKKTIAMAIFLSTVLISGCWDYQELNELGFVMAIGVDTSSQPGMNEYSFQIVNPSAIVTQSNANPATSTTVFSTKGQTQIEAIRKVSQQTNRHLFFSHKLITIFSEEVARQGGLKKLFDSTERAPEGRVNVPILIARNVRAKQVIQNLTPLERISGYELNRKVFVAEKNSGLAINPTAKDIIENLVTLEKSIAISGIEMINLPPSLGAQDNILHTSARGQTKIKGIGLFRNGILVRWVDDESIIRSIALVMNRLKRSIFTIPCERDKKSPVAIQTRQSRTRLNSEITKGKPHFRIEIMAEGRIGEAACLVDFEDPRVITHLENALTQKIRHNVEQAIKITQTEKSDIFGFGDTLHRQHPDEWRRKWKYNWLDSFAKAKVDVHVKFFIRHTGLRTNSYFKEKE